ncbi:MAG: type II toxin-antitoxin system VapC family toxin [Prevotellaceae bacterium]|nr:type II toxin-antitoxin system VapC family toxin [Prevotellaceae bacterium]
MRLYLDTNVLVYMVTGKKDRIDKATLAMLSDYSNLLYTSIICVHELVYLLQSGKVARGKNWSKNVTVLSRIAEFSIEIVPVSLAHIAEEERLPLLERHKDPVDRLIVAQAIADRITLVSKDHEFPRYRQYGLELQECR